MTGPSNDDWVHWGDVEDKQATLGVVKALQAKGHRVRVVADDHRNRIFIIGSTETTA